MARKYITKAMAAAKKKKANVKPKVKPKVQAKPAGKYKKPSGKTKKPTGPKKNAGGADFFRGAMDHVKEHGVGLDSAGLARKKGAKWASRNPHKVLNVAASAWQLWNPA